jgi:hypothetical protein
MDYEGKLSNLKPPPAKTNIRIPPYVLTSFNHFSGYDFTTKPQSPDFKTAGEVKWTINSNAVLDIQQIQILRRLI